MSRQTLNLSRISQPATKTSSIRISGSPPPELRIDPRFDRAFPEQAENLRRHSRELEEWWRQIALELSREQS